jgi:5-formyltetrahydrofolate cyclo-ligase
MAYDRQGGRLGRGGGYYDRFLGQPGLRAVRCGLAFAEQVVDELPTAPHDQPVDIVVTDQEVLRFNR